MRDLHKDAGAVAKTRVGADGAAMLEVAQDRQGIRNDLMRLLALDVGDEADAAGILFERRIEKTFGRRPIRMLDRFGGWVRQQRLRGDLALEP